MIEVGIRISSHIDMLNKIVNEVVNYDVWSALWGEEWIERIKAIQKAINELYSLREKNSELEIDFSFSSAQLLKKMMLYFIRKNYKEIDSKDMREITEFIFTIEERIESDICDSASLYYPGVNAWDKKREI